MCGKGGGSPCLWICYVFLFCTFMAFEHNYNRACGISFFIAYLTFINKGGGKMSSTIIIIAKNRSRLNI